MHYYHSATLNTASAPALAVLDDALTLMQFGVKEELRPSRVVLHGARASVQGDLSSLNSAFIQPAGRPHPHRTSATGGASCSG